MKHHAVIPLVLVVALGGCSNTLDRLSHIGSPPPPDALAIGLTLGPGRTIHAPIAPGVIAPIGVAAHIWLAAGATFDLPTGTVLALDGEREVNAREGERWQVRVVADGVAVVNVEAALAASAMRDSGLYATA